MIVYLTLDNKCSWYLSGPCQHFNTERETYSPYPIWRYTLCCKEGHNFMLQVMETWLYIYL